MRAGGRMTSWERRCCPVHLKKGQWTVSHQPALPAPVDYFRAGVSWKWLTRLQTNVISSGYTSAGLIQMFHTITLHYIWLLVWSDMSPRHRGAELQMDTTSTSCVWILNPFRKYSSRSWVTTGKSWKTDATLTFLCFIVIQHIMYTF